MKTKALPTTPGRAFATSEPSATTVTPSTASTATVNSRAGRSTPWVFQPP